MEVDAIYSWLTEQLRTEFEEVRLLKKSSRGSVRLIRHRASGKQFIQGDTQILGTTGLAAKRHGRHYIGVEINPDFCRLAEERIAAGAHQGRNTARQADSANPSTSPEKAAQSAPKPPKAAEKEEA